MRDIKKVVITGSERAKIKEEFIKRGYQYDFIIKNSYEVNEEDLSNSDLFIGFTPPVNASLKKVPWVHSSGAGVDKFFVQETIAKDAIFTRVRGNFGNKIAEYVLSFILRENYHHQIFEKNGKMGKWDTIMPKFLKNQRALIFGCGNIGQKIAENLNFLELKCDGVASRKREIKPFEEVFTFAEIEKKESLANYDFIILILPLTVNTKHIITPQILEKMKSTVLINAGRGELLKEEDLLEAIQNKNIKKAYLDVFKIEPLAEDSKLWNKEEIFVTPHVAAMSEPYEVVDSFEECLKCLEENKRSSLFVDIERGY